jgi:hypothetical protein
MKKTKLFFLNKQLIQKAKTCNRRLLSEQINKAIKAKLIELETTGYVKEKAYFAVQLEFGVVQKMQQFNKFNWSSFVEHVFSNML